MAVYKFEKERNNGDIQKCVAKVQYVLFTLKILSEMQVRLSNKVKSMIITI